MMKRVSSSMFWVAMTAMILWCGFVSYTVTDGAIGRLVCFVVLTVPAGIISWRSWKHYNNKE